MLIWVWRWESGVLMWVVVWWFVWLVCCLLGGDFRGCFGVWLGGCGWMFWGGCLFILWFRVSRWVVVVWLVIYS